MEGGISDFTNTYGYDNLGNMTSIVQTGGDGTTPKYVSLSYDAGNRLQEIDRYASNENTNLVASSTYTYDHDSELTALTYSAPGLATPPAYHWLYNNDGLVTDAYSLGDTAGSADPSNYLTWSDTHYNYDHDGQLIGTSYTKFYDPPTTGTSETLDPNGNNTNHGSPGDGNRLLTDGTYRYTYDADGNRIARTDIATGAVTTYQWNNANELIGVSGPGVDATYGYDAFGARSRRRKTGRPRISFMTGRTSRWCSIPAGR